MKPTVVLTLFLVLAGSAFAETLTVVQKDKKFDKTEVTINQGDSIVFKNDEDVITHNVFSLGPKNAFDLKVQEPHKTSEPTVFKEVGDTDIECAIHSNMKLKVHVKKK